MHLGAVKVTGKHQFFFSCIWIFIANHTGRASLLCPESELFVVNTLDLSFQYLVNTVRNLGMESGTYRLYIAAESQNNGLFIGPYRVEGRISRNNDKDDNQYGRYKFFYRPPWDILETYVLWSFVWSV